jgi:hypothetical protein
MRPAALKARREHLADSHFSRVGPGQEIVADPFCLTHYISDCLFKSTSNKTGIDDLS